MSLSVPLTRQRFPAPLKRGSRYGWLAALAIVLLQDASTQTLRPEGNREQLSKVVVPFVANFGQTDPSVVYYAQTFAGTIFVTKDGEIVYSLPGKREARPKAIFGKAEPPASSGWSLTESVVGARARPTATDQASTHVSSFIGNDPAHWKNKLPAYGAVSLGEVWSGVSLELKARGRSVEKIFTLEPGADASRIRMRIAGAQSLRLNKEGGMVVETGLGEVRFTPPSAYQQHRGSRQSVRASYILKGREYGFRVSDHDPSLPVVIDPLIQSTYLGGSGGDFAYALAIHPISGDVYVAGQTGSTDFPGTIGGAQSARANNSDGGDTFIARLTADLTTLTKATYLGGTGGDFANALAIHPFSGDVYVAGSTNSGNFPGTTGGAQAANRGFYDAFVARLTADLTRLIKATYLGGGSGDELAYALSIHPTSGDVYVAGQTYSSDFPGTTGGAQAKQGGFGRFDAFVARLTADLTRLIKATYLGGSHDDIALALAIHPTSGDVYVAGETFSVNFPGTTGGAQAASGGYSDGFAARLTADLTTLAKATYLGGSNYDYATALAIPASGNVYVAGYTSSDDFPGTTDGAQAASRGHSDAFAALLTDDLTTLTRATYLGGSEDDVAFAIAIHPSSGDVYVAGFTLSTNLLDTTGGAQAEEGGAHDAFAARLTADLTTLTKATYLGGSGDDFASALAIHPISGDVYVAGHTASTNLLDTTGGAQAGQGGSYDGFVARFTVDLAAIALRTPPVRPARLRPAPRVVPRLPS